MFSDFLRRNWHWVLGILASALLFIISPILFAIVLTIVVITYVVIHKRRHSVKNGAIEAKVRVLRSYGTINTSNLRSGRVCLNVDFDDEVVRIGNNWISAISPSVLDSSLIHEVLGLATVITDGNSNYLVVHGNDVNEVFIKVNTIIEMLRSRNVPFRQLSASEIINEVVLRWMS